MRIGGKMSQSLPLMLVEVQASRHGMKVSDHTRRVATVDIFLVLQWHLGFLG